MNLQVISFFLKKKKINKKTYFFCFVSIVTVTENEAMESRCHPIIIQTLDRLINS